MSRHTEGNVVLLGLVYVQVDLYLGDQALGYFAEILVRVGDVGKVGLSMHASGRAILDDM
jgi:hypothetical protein